MTKTLYELARENVIDSRDLAERLEELEADQLALADAREAHEEAEKELIEAEEEDDIHMAEDRLSEARKEVERLAEYFGPEEADELAALIAISDDMGDCFLHGETMVSDGYFKTYAEELAEDIGAINAEAEWPNNCIDWDRAARELKMDYTSIEIEGDTFYFRG